jgi:Fe2+ or Zn2+ uptake regulation protein
MTLTKNQRTKVREDIERMVKSKPKISAEEVFEKLNLQYTGVSLTDIKSIMAELQ